MNILSTDTAFGNTSVCITSNGKTITFQQQFERDSQAEKLFLIIESCLKEANLSYQDIDIFSANLGPGSFTGIRIGLSGIRAVAHSLNKKFYGVTSFEAMAWKFSNSYQTKNCHSSENQNLDSNFHRNYNTVNSFNFLINANRNEVYIQKFNDISAVSEAELISLSDIEKFSNQNALFICDNEKVLEFLKDKKLNHHPEIININAQDMAEYLYYSLKNNNNHPQVKSPLYIRKPDAKLPNKLQNQINY